MARPLRIEYPGAFYHIIQRGNEKKNIFLSERDREKFFEYLNSAYLRYDIKIHAYCLMNNHYHLILQTNQANLSRVMHFINTSYAVYFNTKRKRSGHLFQGRYKALLVQADEYLHHLSRYIHLNPVRIKLVDDPKDYPYSSYSYFVSNANPPKWLNTSFLLSIFNENIKKAKTLYKNFTMDYIGQETPIITNNIKAGFILANQEFVSWVKETFIHNRTDKEIPAIENLRRNLDPLQIKNQVESKIKDKKLARKISIYLMRKYTTKTLKEIAALLGNAGYVAVSQTYSRFEKTIKEDNGLNREVGEIEKMLNVKT